MLQFNVDNIAIHLLKISLTNTYKLRINCWNFEMNVDLSATVEHVLIHDCTSFKSRIIFLVYEPKCITIYA